MTDIIDYSAFEQARTPEALTKLLEEKAEDGFCIAEFDELVGHLEDYDELVGYLFSNGATNDEVFWNVENAALAMIGVGYELIRILELWRGRHMLGDTAEVIAIRGRPKFGVMCAIDDQLVVQHDNVRHTERLSGDWANKAARMALRKLKPVNPFKS